MRYKKSLVFLSDPVPLYNSVLKTHSDNASFQQRLFGKAGNMNRAVGLDGLDWELGFDIW